jgi:mRNA-degrading endonuclease RelE of RelBE toxin-antitoxin system
MIIRKTENFLGHFSKLPKDVKNIYEKQEEIFSTNWLDSRLHSKRLKELNGVFSFRITRRYRVLFYFKNKEAIFFSIGHRKDIYE